MCIAEGAWRNQNFIFNSWRYGHYPVRCLLQMHSDKKRCLLEKVSSGLDIGSRLILTHIVCPPCPIYCLWLLTAIAPQGLSALSKHWNGLIVNMEWQWKIDLCWPHPFPSFLAFYCCPTVTLTLRPWQRKRYGERGSWEIIRFSHIAHACGSKSAQIIFFFDSPLCTLYSLFFFGNRNAKPNFCHKICSSGIFWYHKSTTFALCDIAWQAWWGTYLPHSPQILVPPFFLISLLHACRECGLGGGIISDSS